MVSCPECDAKVTIPEPVRLNEIVECAECRAELEVVSVEPLLVALAPEAEEDWGE
jgi:alpha-aminoadipate carrier protein LysW